MAEGVAEVQKLAHPTVKFIALHDVALLFHAGCHDCLERLAGRDLRQRVKQSAASEYAVFDDLGAAVQKCLARKRVQRVKVA